MKKHLLILAGTAILFGCGQEKSKTTGWNYNDPKHGGFEVSTNFTEQNTPPGMVLLKEARLLWDVLNKMFDTIGTIFLKA